MKPMPLKAWYRRGDRHPPHFDAGEITQFVTFRLVDSLPQEKLRTLRETLDSHEIEEDTYHERIDSFLDAGYGQCWLRDPPIADMVQSACLHFDADRYDLHGWIVMPNHVHVLMTPRGLVTLPGIIHSWKSFTSKAANRILKRAGSFWQDDYFDRFMRDEKHLDRTLAYIAENPLRAGLCSDPYDYRWSHVSIRR